jgi:hypothetical protein
VAWCPGRDLGARDARWLTRRSTRASAVVDQQRNLEGATGAGEWRTFFHVMLPMAIPWAGDGCDLEVSQGQTSRAA